MLVASGALPTSCDITSCVDGTLPGTATGVVMSGEFASDEVCEAAGCFRCMPLDLERTTLTGEKSENSSPFFSDVLKDHERRGVVNSVILTSNSDTSGLNVSEFALSWITLGSSSLILTGAASLVGG